MVSELESFGQIVTFADAAAYTAWVESEKHGKPRAFKVSHPTETMVKVTFKNAGGATVTNMPVPIGMWEHTRVGQIITAVFKMDGSTNITGASEIFYGF
jgi:hypothetical protein